ncbi:hypothetical protein NV379_00230 [Paenibacillus sp. N1-5-1-14]|uniref:hypothetical protein n=1 Tax=Paenibacillus radicibacter TaxID=2972488 RepID=UPI002159B2F2|nr:hypothetical protein [Paenibacillus radicibacter]MCR8641068.1 hypothetical protein [Paenibacillus radicibacter]
MQITIQQADMSFTREEGYVGHVEFSVEGHPAPYEITLQKSRKGKEWNYALNYSKESGPEENIMDVEEEIEENDELFDLLVKTALDKLEQAED